MSQIPTPQAPHVRPSRKLVPQACKRRLCAHTISAETALPPTVPRFQPLSRPAQLPEQTHGAVDDVLESLLLRHMGPGAARSALASRLVDKNLMLDNPTAAMSTGRALAK